ncbi:MAG: DNA polymerase IV [Cyclobacteriaceae bacterium]|nr:DNA polymerase IV [Cyclobacteriaceae bacterium]
MRKIIHIDMDAFYASIEQRDNPAFRGKPLAVGGSPEGRGVVAAASYEARKFGVRSAMSSRRAIQLCKDLVFVRPRFDVYKEVSRKIRAIFQRYTDIIEPLSLDEAYLDVTEDKLGIGSAIDIAERIRKEIKSELNLTASAGISINKFVAKIASDIHKPDGLTFIGPSKIEKFMESLPVEKFYGVGKVTAEKMKKLGLSNGADLKALTAQEMEKHFGKSGRFYYQIVRGIDNRPVQPHRQVKSVGAEDTFAYDLEELSDLLTELDRIAQLVIDRLQRNKLKGRTLTLKVKYHDFRQITRSKSSSSPIDWEDIASIAKELMKANYEQKQPIRLLGITLSNFYETKVSEASEDDSDQLRLF